MVILALTLCPSLRKRENAPLASLSVSDILFTALHPPMWVNVLLNPEFRLPWGLCVLQSYTAPALWGVSLCHMGCIAVYRYFRVIHFHRFPAMTSTKAVCAEIALAWLVPVLAFIAPHVHPVDSVSYSQKLKRCAAVRMINTQVKTTLAVGVLILPCVVAMVFYVAMYMATRRSTNTILVNSRQNSASASCMSHAEHTNNVIDTRETGETAGNTRSELTTKTNDFTVEDQEICLPGSISIAPKDNTQNKEVRIVCKKKQVGMQVPKIFYPDHESVNRPSTSFSSDPNTLHTTTDDTATRKPKRNNLLLSDWTTESGQLPLESIDMATIHSDKTCGSKAGILTQKKTNPRLTVSLSLESRSSEDRDFRITEDNISSVSDRDTTTLQPPSDRCRSPRTLLTLSGNRSATTSLASIRDVGRQFDFRRSRAEREMFKMLMSIFVCCVVCNVPAMVMVIIDDRVSEEAFLIGLLLWAGNAAVNPIIYGVMNTKIRKGYREIWNVLTRRCFNGNN
ncbi:uncharacterized protein LOC144866398 [Branchiostoma floridae x Branchiostoma japonicum]